MATTASEHPFAGWQVLVTRPGDLGDALLARLRAGGADATAIPLLRIEPLMPDAAALGVINDLDRHDAVIVTSRHAVAHGMPLLAARWPQWPAGLAWLAVGRATAAALAAWQAVATAPADERSEGLLALPQLAGARRVLLLSGAGGRGVLGPALAARGIAVSRLDVYRREADPAAGAAIADWLHTNRHTPARRAVLVTSEQALHNLPAFAGWLVVAGARIAGVARALGYRDVAVAAGADDEAMLQALRQLAARNPSEERP